MIGSAHSDQHAACSLPPSDVIMDMFQAPTLLEGPFSNTSALMAEREAEPAHLRAGKVVRCRTWCHRKAAKHQQNCFFEFYSPEEIYTILLIQSFLFKNKSPAHLVQINVSHSL